ncbi:MAG: ABC transporter permease [Mycobacteriales bacterium]
MIDLRTRPRAVGISFRRSRTSPLLATGGAIVTVLVLVAVAAPWLAPYDPRDGQSGFPLEPPSASHLLGTNDSGQDIASQLIWGTRTSLLIAVEAATVVLVVGGLVGLTAALLGGWVDTVLMRLADVVLAMPGLPTILLLAALLGPGQHTVIAVLGLFGWPRLARILRSQALSLRQRGFIGSARGFGGGPWYVMRRHLVPALGPVLVTGFVSVAGIAILIEAGLAFLGLADPTVVSWGSILNRALAYPGLYYSALWTWWVLPAGVAITLAVLGFTFLGIGLEPRFHPRAGDRR